jgi:hypothetical protein
MNDHEFYQNLRFETQPRFNIQRLFFIGIPLGLFILLWFLVSHSTLFWVLLLFIGGLAWVASYGWRQALSVIHNLIHELE